MRNDNRFTSAMNPYTIDLSKTRAHWLNRSTILWPIQDKMDMTYYMHISLEGTLKLNENDTIIMLRPDAPNPELQQRFPHLEGMWLRLPTSALPHVPLILKGHVAVSRWRGEELDEATGLQIPGVLDDVLPYDGPLGITYDDDIPTLRVWAPTAQHVHVLLFDDSRQDTFPTRYEMKENPATGVWSLTGIADWTGKYYLFSVSVFTPGSQRIETHHVSDPYSLSLSTNGKRSQIVNLANANLKPAGWDSLTKPPMNSPVDSVIYELHIRDFSSYDASVREAYRGTYKAFTERESAGMHHLRALAEAGLTHVHLLPAFDFGTVNEDKGTWQSPSFEELAHYPPDSESQQALLTLVRDRTGFNWGYDPVHYTVPEGSYSTDPDGSPRIVEFREMVQALNSIGLRVVMDVVYNHTHASGNRPYSVLDQIVPGYYHRLNAEGEVEHSTCCENTASEHTMMEKLMIDSVVTWARAYKVDGFRFDLMGHHMLRNMEALRAALDALTIEQDGVDGKSIYVYGEGWNFGEVIDNRQGINATQENLAGTGIGSFNDRLRDAVRGGSAFGGLLDQGFIAGLYDAPNATEQRSPEERRRRMLTLADWIRVSLTGSLREYVLHNANGRQIAGQDVSYNGLGAGFTLAPQEAVNYISSHDNETLFDAVQLKASLEIPIAERVRMHNLGVSLVMLAQGVPFFHAGVELLRSKSMDRNSYHSGDWFNRIDFTYQSNGWGSGLPPAEENQVDWPLMQTLLGNPALKPSPDDIQAALNHFIEMLRIRRSSRLFRLRTSESICEKLTFLNTGPEQILGLIVMAIGDDAGDESGTAEQVIVAFNATQTSISFTAERFRGTALALHPVQAASYDPLVRTATYEVDSGTFTIPERSTVVFVGPT